MTLPLRTSGDGSITLQPSALEERHPQVHEPLTPSSPGYGEASSICNGVVHHAIRRGLNVLLEKGKTHEEA